MSTTLFNLQREHIAHLQRAYSDILADHGLDSLAIYSGHASDHFADDHAPPFQAYGHFMHWVGLADVQHSWLIIQPGERPQLYLYAPADFWHLPLSYPMSSGWRRLISTYAARKSPHRFREMPPLLAISSVFPSAPSRR